MSKISGLVEKASEVRRQTLDHKPSEVIEAYLTHYNAWLISSHSTGVGVIWLNTVFECSVLAETSLFLSVHGFYESANATLRGLLDIFLTGLHWDISKELGRIAEYELNGRTTNDYALWALGLGVKYPSLSKEIWPTLLANDHIRGYDARYYLRSETEALLAVLNRFVHGRPESRTYDGAFRGSTLNVLFVGHLLEDWLRNTKAVSDLVFIFSTLRYPFLIDSEITASYRERDASLVARVKEHIEENAA